jgi:hypothetical protein
MLKQSGFAEAEIANWVKRPETIVKTVQTPVKEDVTPVKTVYTELNEDELASKELPMETPLREAEYQQPLQSSTVFNQLEQSKNYSKNYSKSYRGYSETELNQMEAPQLKELGIVKAYYDLFEIKQGENGRIIFDPVQ